MKELRVRIEGIEPLLVNNPQGVDPFNLYARRAKSITSKRKKTDEDLLELRKVEIETKLYFDDEIKIYVPSSWIISSMAAISWTKAKVKKADIRACVFVDGSKIKLTYDGMKKVKTKEDVVLNEQFHTLLNLKQGQVRIAKAAPIFHNWSIEFDMFFDDTILDLSEIKRLLEIAAKFGGYGDFRPSYGRATATFI